MKKRRSPWAPLYLTLVLILMYLPIAVVVLYSFNANTSRFPTAFTGFSLQFYEALFRDTRGLLDSLWTSLILAACSCGIAMVIGTLGAIGMAGRKFRGQGAIETLSLLPIMVPEIILGMAFLAVFASVVAFGIQNVSLAYVPPSQASLFLSLESVFGVLFSVMLYGEQIGLRLVMGFALIFVAIVVSETFPLKRREPQGEDAPSQATS